MKRFFASLLTAFGIVANAGSPNSEPADLMANMRAMALAIRPSDVGLEPADFAHRPWGVVMETGLEGGAVYSLAVIADGSTSLYFSTGGGIIGSGQQPNVRMASKSMLEVASKYQVHMKPTSTTPLPKPGQVQFFLLTSKGTLVYSADEQQLGNNRDRFADLFHAGHTVIGQVRLAQEARAKEQVK